MTTRSTTMTIALLVTLTVAALAQPTAPLLGPTRAGYARPDLLTSVRTLEGELDAPDLLVIDARSPAAYRLDHIPGAVNLSPHALDRTVTLPTGTTVPSIVMPPAEVTAILRGIGMNDSSRVVIYADRFAPAETRLFWVLDYYGKRRVSLLDGGFDRWREDGAPVVSGAPDADPATAAPARGDFLAVPDPSKIADFSYVEHHLGSATVDLCDALPESSFEQGAIPGSMSLPAESTFGRLGTLAEHASLLAGALRERHLAPDHEVVFYCATGYLSSMDYFVARLLGYDRVRLYDGSLVDWRAHGGPLPPAGAR